ncbi:MAG: sugar kinase [Chloroflexi bacterium]|nr:sugar kinase [Chloroflexota bacterium]
MTQSPHRSAVKNVSASLDVLAIGEILVDLISETPVERLEDASAFRRYLGGSPANIAANVARLGGRAGLMAAVGEDALGRFLLEELSGLGVWVDGVRVSHDAPTSVMMVARAAGTPAFLPLRGADYHLRPDDIAPALIARVRLLHASAFALSRPPCREAVARAFRLAHDMGKPLSLDPNYSPVIWPDREEALRVLAELYPLVTLTKPSRDDAARLFGPDRSAPEYIHMFHDLGADIVVFTRGGGGALVSERGEALREIPARPVMVADATGAGDAFWAGFLLAWLDGHSVEQSARVGREVAAIKLQRVGPLPRTIDRAALMKTRA